MLAIPKRLNNLKVSKKHKKLYAPNPLQSIEETAPAATVESKSEERKKQLIEKLQNFCKSIDLFLDLSTDDISDFVVLEDRLKCRVSCPYCQSKFACFKKTHWAVSNIESHFKKHKNQIIVEKAKELLNEPIKANTVTINVSDKVSSELDFILQN